MFDALPSRLCKLSFAILPTQCTVVDVVDQDLHDDYCDYCHDGGNLLCCDRCTAAFHLHCLGLDEEPTGDWLCSHCTQEVEAAVDMKKKKKKKASATETKKEKAENSATPSRASTPATSAPTPKALSSTRKPKRRPKGELPPHPHHTRKSRKRTSQASMRLVCSLSFAEQISLALSQSAREATEKNEHRGERARGKADPSDFTSSTTPEVPVQPRREPLVVTW